MKNVQPSPVKSPRRLHAVPDLPATPAPTVALPAETVPSLPVVPGFATELAEDLLDSEPYAALEATCLKAAALRIAHGANLADVLESTARFMFMLGANLVQCAATEVAV